MDDKTTRIHRTEAPPCGTRKAVRRHELDGLKVADMDELCQIECRRFNAERQESWRQRKRDAQDALEAGCGSP